MGAEGTRWENLGGRVQVPRSGEVAQGNCGTQREAPLERRGIFQVGIGLGGAAICAAGGGQFKCSAAGYTTAEGLMEIAGLLASVVR